MERHEILLKVETLQNLLVARATGGEASLGDNIIETETCRYTTTRDEHFILDLHSAHPQVAFSYTEGCRLLMCYSEPEK